MTFRLAFLIALGIVIVSEVLLPRSARNQAHAQSAFLRGATMYPVLSAASNNSQIVGPVGAQVITGIIGINTAVTAQFLRLYDTDTAPDCTSATNVRSLLPVNTNALNGGYMLPLGEVTFVKGLGICITGAYGLTDNTAAATGLSLTFIRK